MMTERVQVLSSVLSDEIPAKFIRPTHEQPRNTKAVKGVTVPIISLSPELPRRELVAQIQAAGRDWGFFLVTDHGISPSLIQRVQDVGVEFFDLPLMEKEKYSNDPSKGDIEGYGTKLTKNHEEKLEWIDYFFHIMSPSKKVKQEKWPLKPKAYREVTEEYSLEIHRVTDVLLELLSEGLGLEKNRLKSSLGDDDIEMEMKINFYPPCPQPELAVGVEPHTDMSALTILVSNDVPGFQLWNDGHWVAVENLPNALFVHVGDQVEVLSNGQYKSVLHRSLVNKERTRMSWAVFIAPTPEAVIGPLPELVNDSTPEKYKTRTFAEFRYLKLKKLSLE